MLLLLLFRGVEAIIWKIMLFCCYYLRNSVVITVDETVGKLVPYEIVRDLILSASSERCKSEFKTFL